MSAAVNAPSRSWYLAGILDLRSPILSKGKGDVGPGEAAAVEMDSEGGRNHNGEKLPEDLAILKNLVSETKEMLTGGGFEVVSIKGMEGEGLMWKKGEKERLISFEVPRPREAIVDGRIVAVGLEQVAEGAVA